MVRRGTVSSGGWLEFEAGDYAIKLSKDAVPIANTLLLHCGAPLFIARQCARIQADND